MSMCKYATQAGDGTNFFFSLFWKTLTLSRIWGSSSMHWECLTDPVASMFAPGRDRANSGERGKVSEMEESIQTSLRLNKGQTPWHVLLCLIAHGWVIAAISLSFSFSILTSPSTSQKSTSSVLCVISLFDWSSQRLAWRNVSSFHTMVRSGEVKCTRRSENGDRRRQADYRCFMFFLNDDQLS